MIDRRSTLKLIAAAGVSAIGKAQTAPPETGGELPRGLPQPTETIDLWHGDGPGMPKQAISETVTERSTDSQLTDRAVVGISRPRMAVFRPLVSNGAAVLITPGGGYKP